MNRRCIFVLLAVFGLFWPEKSNSQQLCLVGAAETISGLPAQEQLAYNWALHYYGEDAVYLSFDEVLAQGLPNECRRIWFHYTGSLTLLGAAIMAAPIIETFIRDNRNGILLTGIASKYVTALNITDVGPNEDKLTQNSSIDTWGVRPVPGQDNHPLFQGLTLTSDWINNSFYGYRTVKEGVAAPEVWAWWIQGTFPGERIGTMPWLTDANITPIGAIHNGRNQGGALVASLPGFCWISDNGEIEQANLEQFTRNCIGYLYPWPSNEAVEMGEVAMHFSFDKNEDNWAYELIEGKNHPIISNWPAERVRGVHGDGLRIDGYTTYIEGQLNASLFSKDNITFAAWIAIETFPTGQDGGIQLGSIFSNNELDVAINSQGRIFVNIENGGQITSAQVMESDEWIHMAVTVDVANGMLILYKNGQAIGSTHVSDRFSWANRNFWIGKYRTDVLYAGFNINHFNGIIDEVVIHNKTLSAAQIAQDAAFKPTYSPDLTIPASRFANDIHRPRYHAIPGASWANEPHGLIYYNNMYHMFFQKNANGPYWSSLHWGVLTSPDLVNWNEEAPVLRPDPLTTWDRIGIWSGCALFDNENNPIIFYTGVDGAKAGIGVATLDEDKTTWVKYPANPVISAKPAVSSDDFRDPFVWNEGDMWYMMVGGSYNGKGTAWLYRSPDLYNWTYLRPLMTNASGNVGSFWEMPVMLKMGDKHVLIAGKTPDATRARTFYWVGEFANENFIADHTTPKDLDLILGALSPTIGLDNQNRFVGIEIIPDTWNAFLNDAVEHKIMGWANAFTLPKVWTLENGKIHRSPLPELNSLRKHDKLVDKTNVQMTPGGSGYLDYVSGRRLEIDLTFNPGDANRIGLVLGKGSNGEVTRIYFDYGTNQVVADRTQSSLNPNTQKFEPGPASYPLDRSRLINMRVFVDHSIIEVFINNEDAFVTRIFPVGHDSDGIDLFVDGGNATATNVSVWEMSALTPTYIPANAVFQEESGLRIFPNPSTSILSIESCMIEDENALIQVYGLDGSRLISVQATKGQRLFRLNVDELDIGLYVLSVVGHTKKQQTLFMKK